MSAYISRKVPVDDVHASHYSPCGKCTDTCFLLHNYLPADCPLQNCDICSVIATIDDEIHKTEKLLFDLAQKRQDAKRQINSRHDRLFGRLPVEVVSRIFRAVEEPHTGKARAGPKAKHKWASTALLLGAVCKGWRDITLGTPHLWTTISINLWKDSSDLDVVKEWLHRSRSLPLSISFLGRPPSNEDGLEGLGPLLKVVRSHSARWINVTSKIPSSALHALFHQLEDVPEIEHLSIDLFTDQKSGEMQPASLAAPLCPKDYTSHNFPSEKLLFEWHNLTCLHVVCITLDEVVYIVKCASMLTECSLSLLRASDGRFPLPTIPIRHESLKILDAGVASPEAFFDCFTFPSLQNLRYCMEDEDAIDIFSGFLKRSAPPLRNFTLYCYMANVYDTNPWAQGLSAVTHLEVDISQPDDSDSDFLMSSDVPESFFKALETSESLFPNLRDLLVTTPVMTSDSWNSLANFLERTQDAPGSRTVPSGSEGQGHSQLSESDHARVLRKVRIEQIGDMYDDEEPDMGITPLTKFKRVLKSGICLEFYDTNLDVDLLESAAGYYLEVFGYDADSGTFGSIGDDSDESGGDEFGDHGDSDESEDNSDDEFGDYGDSNESEDNSDGEVDE